LPAAEDVLPPLEMPALGVLPEVQVLSPLLVRDLVVWPGPGDVALSATAVLNFIARPTKRAIDLEH
jgi:hypothetical protein